MRLGQWLIIIGVSIMVVSGIGLVFVRTMIRRIERKERRKMPISR